MDGIPIIFAYLCILFHSTTEYKTDDECDFSTLAYSKGFVDKTLFIKRFFESPIEKLFVTAPKGFGKSTNMNMIRTFAQMQINPIGFDASNTVADFRTKKIIEKPLEQLTENFSLFKNNSLNIYTKHRKFFHLHCGKHPILYLNLKNVRIQSYKNFLEDMSLIVARCFKEYDHLGTSRLVKKLVKRRMNKYLAKMAEGVKTINFNIKRALRFLCKAINEHYDRKVVLLMDEVDTPIMKGINKKEFYLYKVWRFIQQFTWNLVKSRFVGRALINSRAELLTILPEHRRSYFNHVSFLRDKIFSEFYGFTAEDISALSLRFQSRNDSLANIRSSYGGYTVEKTGTELYNIQSVLNYFNISGSHRNNSWFNEVQLKNMDKLFLQKELRSRIETMLEGHPVEISLRNDLLDLPFSQLALLQEIITHYNCSMEPFEAELIMQYLLEFGYFNINGTVSAKNCVNVTMPNTEIAEYFAKLVYSENYLIEKFNFKRENIYLYIENLLKLNGHDRNTFVELANSVETLFKQAKAPENIPDIYRSLLVFASQSRKFKTVDGKYHKYHCCYHFRLIRNDGIEMIIVVKFQVGSAHSGLEEAVNHGLKPVGLGTEHTILCLHLDNVKKCTIAYMINSVDIKNVIHVSAIK